MRIDEQDLFHGAALTQVVEHPSFTALNKASRDYGHYLVNHDRRLFVKYRNSAATSFQFTFSPGEIATIARDERRRGQLFVVLVCGRKAVCALDPEEFWQLVDSQRDGQQWIRLEVKPGRSIRASGTAGSLHRAIPRNGFPHKVLA